jgi:hypothetical protein
MGSTEGLLASWPVLAHGHFFASGMSRQEAETARHIQRFDGIVIFNLE